MYFVWIWDSSEFHQQWRGARGIKWTSALEEPRQWWGDGRGMTAVGILQSGHNEFGWEKPSAFPPVTPGRARAGCGWPGPGSFWDFFWSVPVKQQPHCHMCLEFDFQAKCQPFHAKPPSGFGPGSPAVKAWPFQYLDHLPARTYSGILATTSESRPQPQASTCSLGRPGRPVAWRQGWWRPLLIRAACPS